MKTLRTHLPFRALCVAVLMASWFLATNHCALGLMKRAPKIASEHASCHGGGKPGHDEAPGGLRECCKALNGAPLPAKAEVKFDAAKFQIHLFVVLSVVLPQVAEPPTVFFSDTGPPHAVSFAESVLQRCLLGHAPPFAV